MNLENDNDFYSACSNPTIGEFHAAYFAWGFSAYKTYQLTLALQISSTLDNYWNLDIHYDKTSGIRSHAMEIISNIHFGWKKDISYRQKFSVPVNS
jgi:hypothetical protein